MRFMTWNIGSSYKQKESGFAYMTDEIRKYCPDVVALQELKIDSPYLEKLSRQIGMRHFVTKVLSASHQTDGLMGIGLFSREKIEKIDEFMLQNPNVECRVNGRIESSHDKGFLYCTVGGLAVVTGHAFPFHRYAIDEFTYRESIYEPFDVWVSDICLKTRTAVILGDFNTEYVRQLMPGLHLHAQPLLSAPTRPNGRRDDYIFCTRPEAVREAGIIEGEFDHFCCMMDME